MTYYTATGAPITQGRGTSKTIRDEFDLIESGFSEAAVDISAIAAAVGVAVAVAETDVASATTTDIGNGYGSVIRITGTNAILSFGANYNGAKQIRFADILTLVNSSTLVLPGGSNITTAAGDVCIAVPIGSPASGWRVGDFTKMANAPGVATIAGTVAGQTATGTSLIQAASATAARSAISAAASGANADITSLTNLTAGGLPDNSVLTADIADAQVTPAKLSQPLTLGTAVPASGSSTIQFTGIPSWAKRVTVIMSGLSTSGTTNYQLQVGAGSFSVTGYVSSYANIDGTNTTTTGSATTSFVVKTSVGAANTYSGIAVLSYLGSNTWVCTSQVNSNSGVCTTQSGTITLGGAMDRVQLTADTFDAGSINILYE